MIHILAKFALHFCKKACNLHIRDLTWVGTWAPGHLGSILVTWIVGARARARVQVQVRSFLTTVGWVNRREDAQRSIQAVVSQGNAPKRLVKAGWSAGPERYNAMPCGGAQKRRGPVGPKRLSAERVVSRARLANGAACRKPFIAAPPRKLLAEPTGRLGALLLPRSPPEASTRTPCVLTPPAPPAAAPPAPPRLCVLRKAPFDVPFTPANRPVYLEPPPQARLDPLRYLREGAQHRESCLGACPARSKHVCVRLSHPSICTTHLLHVSAACRASFSTDTRTAPSPSLTPPCGPSTRAAARRRSRRRQPSTR